MEDRGSTSRLEEWEMLVNIQEERGSLESMEGVGEQNTGVGTGNRWKINRVLKCITLNAQSLKNKMVELRALVDEKKPHIISITESWGKDSVCDGIFSLLGYRMYRDDRAIKKVEGGFFILVKN